MRMFIRCAAANPRAVLLVGALNSPSVVQCESFWYRASCDLRAVATVHYFQSSYSI
jgi:hypothetical protein